MNRTQILVLAFFAMALIGLGVILAASPDVYAQSLRFPGVDARVLAKLFFVAVATFLVLPTIGVIRRWRWIFWLLLIAFLAGILRPVASSLELMGLLPPAGPVWFTVLQAGFGLAQFLIGLAMVAGYRRSGPWGAF